MVLHLTMAQEPIAQGPKPGPFDERDSHRTLALEVEERKFWVPRETLASYSPVFKAMLYGEFAEANKDSIKLPDKKARDIDELLLCLIPTPEMKPIDYSNVELMLKLADEYQIEELRRRATNALITMTKEWPTRDSRLLEILRMGSVYRTKEALQEIIKRCGIEFKLNELESMFNGLRVEVIAGLMQYRAQRPVDSKCRFEHGSQSFLGMDCCLGGHTCTVSFKCVYCGAGCCAKCLESGVVGNAKCKLVGYTGRIESVVRTLLNRM